MKEETVYLVAFLVVVAIFFGLGAWVGGGW